MRIIAEKREDILRERDEYKREWEANESKREEESNAYYSALDSVTAPVKEYLEYQLGHYSALTFDVRVDRSYSFSSREHEGLDVRIECNRPHQEDSALSWHYYAKVDGSTGEIIRETGSWSGLQATTLAQMKSLRQSVSALEFLNELDWEDLLLKKLPKLEDYHKTRSMPNRDSEFNSRLMQADLEALVGTNTLVQVQNFESSGFRGRTIYVRIIRETPSQYVVNVLSEWDISRLKSGELNLDDRYQQRVKKSNIVPINKDGEIVTLEV